VGRPALSNKSRVRNAGLTLIGRFAILRDMLRNRRILCGWLMVFVLGQSLVAHADILLVLAPDISNNDQQTMLFALQQITGAVVRVASVMDAEDATESDRLGAPPAASQQALQSATKAWRRMDFDEALSQLESARELCLDGAPVAVCADLIFDAEFLAGAIYLAQGQGADADRAFRSAHAMRPDRVMDPGRFSPAVIRAFGVACARTEGLPALSVSLESKPTGARFQLNGRDAGSEVQLLPGRYAVSAHLLGHDATTKNVVVSADGSGPPLLRFDMQKLDENAAWQQVRRLLGEGPAGIGQKDARRLFRRFGVTHVVFAEQRNDAFLLFVSRPGSLERTALPAVATWDEIEKHAYRALLFDALNLTLPKAPIATSAAKVPPEEPRPALDADDGESETFVEMRAMPQADPKDDGRKKTSVARSPWLWIATGAAAIIVTSVAITMAAQ